MSAIPTVVLLAAVVVILFLGLLGLLLYWIVYGPRARVRRRVQQLAGTVKGRPLAKGGAGGAARRRAVQNKLQEVEASRLKKRGHKLREALIQAGLSLSARQFVMASIGSSLVAALLPYLFGLPLPAMGAFAVIGGLGVPRLVIKILAQRRVKKFTAHFADAIDVIVRGIRSGLPVGECFNMIARESPDPVGTEFRIIVEGQRLGLTIEEALDRAAERVPTAELRYFGIVLSIQQTTGGNLAETLAKLSEVLRARKRMRDKIQAVSSEAKASAGIIGSLPVVVALLLAIVAPAYIGTLFHTEPGHLILLAGVSTMGVGILVMRRMINFDI